MNPHERRGERSSNVYRPGTYRRDSGPLSRSVSPRGGRDSRRDSWAPNRDNVRDDRDRGRAPRDNDSRDRRQDRDWGPDRVRDSDRDRGGGRSPWAPTPPRTWDAYYTRSHASLAPGEIVASPEREDDPRGGRSEPEVNEQLGEQIDSLARALVDVIQRTGKQSIAKRALDIRTQFGGESGTGDAKKDLETASKNVKESMAALQSSFVKLLREALAGVGPGIRGQSFNAVELEAIRDRIERVEHRQSRAASPHVDKGKGRAPPPPPPSVAPPEQPPAPPSAPASEAEGSTAGQATGAEPQSESSDAKRRRARRLLENLIKRVEQVEEKTDLMTERYDDVLNEISEHNNDIILQSDEIGDVRKELEAIKARRRRRATEGAMADTSAQASEASVPVAAPTPAPASASAPTQADSASAIVTSSQLDRGEADMDIDEESQPSGRPSLELDAPKDATADLVTQVAALRDEMMAMKERMESLQTKAGDTATTPTTVRATATETATVTPMDAATASRMGLSVPPQSERTITPSDSLNDAITKLQEEAQEMAAKLTKLEERVNTTVARADLEAMFTAERIRVVLEAQEVVQGLLDQDRLNVARQASELCISDVTSRMDELIKERFTPLVEQALVSLASKAAAPASTPSGPSSSPSIPLQQRLPAVINPVSLQQRTSASVPLQHRMQGGQNGTTQKCRLPGSPTLTQVPGGIDPVHRMLAEPDTAPQASSSNSSNQPRSLTDAERAFINHASARSQSTLPPQSPAEPSQAPVLSRTPSQPNSHQLPNAQSPLAGRLGNHSAQSLLSPTQNSRNSTPEVVGMNSTTAESLPTVPPSPQIVATASPTVPNTSGVGTSQQAGRRTTPAAGSNIVPSPEQLSDAGVSPEVVLVTNIDILYKYKILRQYPGFLESRPEFLEQVKAHLAEQQQIEAHMQARQAQAVQQPQPPAQSQPQQTPAQQRALLEQLVQQQEAQSQPQQTAVQQRTLLEQLAQQQQALQGAQPTQPTAQQLDNPQQPIAALQAQTAQHIQQQLRQAGLDPSSLPLLPQQLFPQQQQHTQ